jgi:1,4-alpha-glucan branching enzyme
MQQSDSEIRSYSGVSPEIQRLLDARHHDPFSVLGRHVRKDRVTVRVIMPRAAWVRIVESGVSLERIAKTDLFEWQ